MLESGVILAIEISNPAAGGAVAVGRVSGGDVTDVVVETVGRGSSRAGGFGGHDDDLMPAIDRVCRRAQLAPRMRELQRVGVSIGPGGYTSTRVACATGKMIAEAGKGACVGVPTALVVLESVPGEVRTQRIAIALASKGESAWVQVFEAAVAASEGRLVAGDGAADLFRSGIGVLIADGHLPATMRGIAERAGVRIIEPVFDAAACLRLTARLPAIDPAELVPLYPREPDAVTLWRARKKT